MKWTVCAITALGIVLGTQAAPAKGPPPLVKKKIMREIGLSDEQIKKIDDLTYQADREKLDIRHELQKARLEMQRLMSADRPERKAVFAQLEKISALQLRLKKNRVGLMLEIRTLLDREQWEKLEVLQMERRSRKRERKRIHRTERHWPDRPPLTPRPHAPPGPRGP